MSSPLSAPGELCFSHWGFGMPRVASPTPPALFPRDPRGSRTGGVGTQERDGSVSYLSIVVLHSPVKSRGLPASVVEGQGDFSGVVVASVEPKARPAFTAVRRGGGLPPPRGRPPAPTPTVHCSQRNFPRPRRGESRRIDQTTNKRPKNQRRRRRTSAEDGLKRS